jgi:peptidyl-tRNA hydrolase
MQVVLEVKGEIQLLNLAKKLEDAGVRHKIWLEQPEDIPTCIAAAPQPKSSVSQHFKKLKLCNV